GTTVFINLHSVHRDESQWKFPHEFNPSNFLNAKGETKGLFRRKSGSDGALPLPHQHPEKFPAILAR
ncbi:hypothetical protein L345_17798, partial [Ophiophagus hannah]